MPHQSLSDAMDLRYLKLQDTCNKYFDVMRPESLMRNEMPPEQNFAFDARSKIAFCKNHGIGYKAFEALFFKNYIPDQDQGFAVDASARKENWAGLSKTYKFAIMVRHPMERLLSVYR